MEPFVRNALRISLAGAGIVVLGASYVGQASADEAPSSDSSSSSATDSPSDPDTPDTSADGPGSLVSVPAAGELLAPDSLDTFVIPTVSDPLSLHHEG